MQPSFFVCRKSKISRTKTERVPHGADAPLTTRRRRARHREKTDALAKHSEAHPGEGVEFGSVHQRFDIEARSPELTFLGSRS